MVLIVIILFVAFIVTPLFDLIFAERVRVPAKIVVYALALIWIVYVFITNKVVP